MQRMNVPASVSTSQDTIPNPWEPFLHIVSSRSSLHAPMSFRKRSCHRRHMQGLQWHRWAGNSPRHRREKKVFAHRGRFQSLGEPAALSCGVPGPSWPRRNGDVRAPVFAGTPIQGVLKVKDGFIVRIACNSVDDASRDQSDKSGVRERIAHALSRHHAGPERVRPHDPFELPVGECNVLLSLISAISRTDREEKVTRNSRPHRLGFLWPALNASPRASHASGCEAAPFSSPAADRGQHLPTAVRGNRGTPPP